MSGYAPTCVLTLLAAAVPALRLRAWSAGATGKVQALRQQEALGWEITNALRRLR